jgi:hypothetical protein
MPAVMHHAAWIGQSNLLLCCVILLYAPAATIEDRIFLVAQGVKYNFERHSLHYRILLVAQAVKYIF